MFKNIKYRHRYIIEYIKESSGLLSGAMVCMLLTAATSSAVAYLVKPVIDDIFMKKDEKMLALLPALVIVIFLVRGGAMYGQEFLMGFVGERIIKRLRDLLYDRIMDLPLSFFHEKKTGVLMSRVTNDVNVVKNMVSNVVTSALRDFFTVIGLVCVIFYMNWRLAIFAVFVLPVAYYPIIKFGRRVRRFSTRSQESMADLNAMLHETFSGNKIVKAFGMEDYEKKKFFEKSARVLKFDVKTIRVKALTSPVMEILGGIGIAVIIWIGGREVIVGGQSPGSFFSFMAAVSMLYPPVKKLSKLNNAVQQGMAAVDRIFDVIETDSPIKDPENPVQFPPPPHGVTFDHVFFSYEKDETVLHDICLEVSPGENLAIVGMSGGGKTSLVNLIPRFYDVTSGAVLIDGIDIRKVAVSELRKRIAIVTQEPILFDDTIYNNIAYGRKSASEKEVIDAARAAYILDFIESLPAGFQTMIGELGSRLSGGERQRLCIARALVKDAPILILDEATSALDSEAERLVQKALKNLLAGRTSFVIAHRLSTIIDADRIVVLINGRIVESGTHAELLQRNGEYARIFTMQYGNAQTGRFSGEVGK